MPLSRDFAVTRPFFLFSLAIVTVVVSFVAVFRMRHRTDPLAGISTSDPTAITRPPPLALTRLFGKIEFHPLLGASWYMTAEETIAGDVLIAVEDSAVKTESGIVVLRAGAKVRLWKAATPVVALDQGEIFVDGAFEIRTGGATSTIDGAAGLRLSAGALSVACQRGSFHSNGYLYLAGTIAELRGGEWTKSIGSPADVLKWVDEARARLK